MNAVCMAKLIIDLHITMYKIKAQCKLICFSLWLLILVSVSADMFALLEIPRDRSFVLCSQCINISSMIYLESIFRPLLQVSTSTPTRVFLGNRAYGTVSTN